MVMLWARTALGEGDHCSKKNGEGDQRPKEEHMVMLRGLEICYSIS